jgi:membrane protein DedA with SNARE-associated domain
VSVSLALFTIHVPEHVGLAAIGLIVFAECMGVPSPGETAIVVGSVLASKGDLAIEEVIAVAVAAAILGDNVGFLIGRHGGRRLLERRGRGQARRQAVLAYADDFFERHGPKAVFLGRWVVIVRVTAAWMAGASAMRFRTFFVYNALGGITWATTVGLLAYLLGQAGGDAVGKLGAIGAILLVVTTVGLFVSERRRTNAKLRGLRSRQEAEDHEMV